MNILTAVLVLGLYWSAATLCADEIFLKNDQILEGTILKTDGKTITLQMSVGGGTAEAPYPVANIQKIKFNNTPEQQTLLDSQNLEELPRMAELWVKREPFLGMPESNAGEVGLRYVKLLLGKGTKKAAAEAVEVAARVVSGDWSPLRKTEATRLRLTALAASGKVEQAMAESEKIQEISGADEEGFATMKTEARLTRASLASVKLLELEKEWPKWVQMPEKRKEHTELLNTALDGFLFAAVFHPELTNLTAEGLWRAAELSRSVGRQEDALVMADEIILWFPKAEFKTKAENLKRELEKETKAKASQAKEKKL